MRMNFIVKKRRISVQRAIIIYDSNMENTGTLGNEVEVGLKGSFIICL